MVMVLETLERAERRPEVIPMAVPPIILTLLVAVFFSGGFSSPPFRVAAEGRPYIVGFRSYGDDG